MMCSLLLVAGLHLNPCLVSYLAPHERSGCVIHFTERHTRKWVDAPCGEVANMINEGRK